MTSAAYSKIKELDMFGHTISLNFNNRGSTHNTIVGALLSLPSYIFMIFYLVLLYKRVNDPSFDDLAQFHKSYEFDDLDTF